jgi:hypothetical protein
MRQITLQIRRDSSLARVFGIVKDKDGFPIYGAQIRLGELTSITDSFGYYVLHIPFEYQSEEQRIRAVKSGYLEFDRTHPIISGVPNDILLLKE